MYGWSSTIWILHLGKVSLTKISRVRSAGYNHYPFHFHDRFRMNAISNSYQDSLFHGEAPSIYRQLTDTAQP